MKFLFFPSLLLHLLLLYRLLASWPLPRRRPPSLSAVGAPGRHVVSDRLQISATSPELPHLDKHGSLLLQHQMYQQFVRIAAGHGSFVRSF